MTLSKLFTGIALWTYMLLPCSCRFSIPNSSSVSSSQQTEADTDEATSINDDSLTFVVTSPNTPNLLLKRTGYVVSYNTETLIPNWVAWHLTAHRLEGKASRKGFGFHPDEDAPEPQVDTFDYMRSGYDRGHMCPAADNKWDLKAMEESFLMTNICPQNHNLNVGDWSEMENQCRTWARKWGDVYVICGPILYRGKHKHIGEHKVVVPEAFFKVVLSLKGTPKAIGFIYKNEAGNRSKGDYVNSVDEVERITGFDFFSALPDKLENELEAEADLNNWY